MVDSIFPQTSSNAVLNSALRQLSAIKKIRRLRTANLLAVALMGSFFIASAQKTPRQSALGNDGAKLAFAFSFGGHLPGGDLAKRFGPDNSIGFGTEFFTKNNWIAAAEGLIFFGKTVKEDPLAKLRTPEGFLIGNDRRISEIQLRSRGWHCGGSVGRLFAFSKANKGAGLRLTIGAGWTQHKIRIQDSDKTAVQIAGANLKGYDRLTGGLNLTQFVGYQRFSKSRRGNFFIGFDFEEGLAKSLRDWDFDLMKKDGARRLDLRFGLRAGYQMAFYVGEKGEEIYY